MKTPAPAAHLLQLRLRPGDGREDAASGSRWRTRSSRTQIEEILERADRRGGGFLDTIVAELSRPEARDPKTAAVRYFLTEHRTEGKTWLEHGCIVFSQYYDTVRALAADLAAALLGEPIAIYAGAGKSGIYRDGDFATVEREEIKAAVKSARSASWSRPTLPARD